MCTGRCSCVNHVQCTHTCTAHMHCKHQHHTRLTLAAVPAPMMLLVVNTTVYPGCPSLLVCSHALVSFIAPAAAASSLAPNKPPRPPSCPGCCCCCSAAPPAAAEVSGVAGSCIQVLLPGRVASSHVLAVNNALSPVARLTTRTQARCQAAGKPAAQCAGPLSRHSQHIGGR